MLRFDAAIARAVARSVGGKMSDLMPWPKEIEKEGTVDEVFGMFKTMSANNKGKK